MQLAGHSFRCYFEPCYSVIRVYQERRQSNIINVFIEQGYVESRNNFTRVMSIDVLLFLLALETGICSLDDQQSCMLF